MLYKSTVREKVMRNTNWILRITGMALIVAFTFAIPSMAQNPKDKAAIKSIVNQIISALNSVDEGKMRGAINHLSGSMGTLYVAQGTQRVSDLRSNPLAGLENVSTRTYEMTSPIVISVGKTIGWATFEWKSERHLKDGSHQESEGRTTFVFGKDKKTWKITHVHASVPAAPVATAADHSAAGETILAMERAIWDAFEKGDTGPIEDYFSESITVLGSGAAYRTTGKRAVLKSLNDMLASVKFTGHQILDPKIEVHGGTAILTYYYTQSMQAGGQMMTETGKITTIFADEDGTWRVVHHHSTTNPESHE